MGVGVGPDRIGSNRIELESMRGESSCIGIGEREQELERRSDGNPSDNDRIANSVGDIY